MADIARVEPNGLTVASTFAGAGGSSTGWAIAGFRVLWANEFHRPAADSYAANHPETILDRRDVRQVTGDQIVAACDGRVPDVLDGSPPCQDFSMAGKRTRGWGEVRSHGDGTRQRSDDLFDQYIRLVGELRPRAFVAENVKGLVTGAAKGYFKRIHAGLTACGYRVRAQVLDAQWLGVPQRRQRVILIGIRDDLEAEPRFPTPLPYRYSILDACPWLAGFDQIGAGGGYGHPPRSLDDPLQTLTAGDPPYGDGRWQLRHNHTSGMKPTGRLDLDEPAVTITATEGGIDLVRPGAIVAREGRRWANGREMPLDEPIHAITAEGARGLHHSDLSVRLEARTSDRPWMRIHGGEPLDVETEPAWTISAAGINGLARDQVHVTDGIESRRLTIAEVRRLCSFPDDYVLTGGYVEQWARLGNSVPPLMMAAVAAEVAVVLAGRA